MTSALTTAALAELADLAERTYELRESSFDPSTRFGRYTMDHHQAAVTICGADHPWLRIVWFLAITGEGVDVAAAALAKAQAQQKVA